MKCMKLNLTKDIYSGTYEKKTRKSQTLPGITMAHHLILSEGL